MARVVKLVSDISGTEANEEEFISLIVKEHPEIDSPKRLDVLPAEVAKLKGLENTVTLEVRDNGNTREIVMTLAEFRKLVSDEVVKNAASTRGRPLGYSPKKAK